MNNIYLIKSDSYYLLNSKIKELTNDIKDITKVDLDEEEIGTIINDASYYGLFNEKKVIIINNTKYFGGKFLYEDDMNVLMEFLNNLDPNTIIIFVCNEIAKTKDNTKRVLNLGAEIIDLSSLSEEELDEFIKKYLEDNNVKLNDDAKKLLLGKVNNNLDMFLTEINKISLADNIITVDSINEYCSYNEEDITFEFSNAVVAKNFKDAFPLLDKLLEKGVEVPNLIGLLANSYTSMYIVKDAISHGASDAKIEELTGFKSGRIYILKKNSNIYTLDDLKEIIINLSEIDKKIKTGSNPVYVFKEFLLNI